MASRKKILEGLMSLQFPISTTVPDESPVLEERRLRLVPRPPDEEINVEATEQGFMVTWKNDYSCRAWSFSRRELEKLVERAQSAMHTSTVKEKP